MAKFTDQDGREWVLRVNRGTVKAVREALDIDLVDITGDTVKRLYDDLIARVDVLWVLCRDEAEKRGVTDEQFGVALVGASVDAGYMSLVEAIADFSPSHGRVIRAVAEKANRVATAAQDMALKTLADPATDKRLMEAMEAEYKRLVNDALTRLSSATNSPASSG